MCFTLHGHLRTDDSATLRSHTHHIATVSFVSGVGKLYNIGLDLKWMRSLSKESFPAKINEFFSLYFEAVATVLSFPAITIAAMNGHAIGG